MSRSLVPTKRLSIEEPFFYPESRTWKDIHGWEVWKQRHGKLCSLGKQRQCSISPLFHSFSARKRLVQVWGERVRSSLLSFGKVRSRTVVLFQTHHPVLGLFPVYFRISIICNLVRSSGAFRFQPTSLLGSDQNTLPVIPFLTPN